MKQNKNSILKLQYKNYYYFTFNNLAIKAKIMFSEFRFKMSIKFEI